MNEKYRILCNAYNAHYCARTDPGLWILFARAFLDHNGYEIPMPLPATVS